MNKEKATKIITLAQDLLKSQKELKELGVEVGFTQSLSDAVSFAQGYLLGVEEINKESNV